MSCFSFYHFSSTKSENRRVEQVRGQGWHQWKEGGEVLGKGVRRMNMVQNMCIHAYKCKK
jgi:hypothetical protein